MPPEDELTRRGRLAGAWHAAGAAAVRVRARLTRGRGGTAAWKVAVGTVGAVVLLAGVAMLALPGPGWATIVAGLAILSTEFRWAARLRHRVVAAVVAGDRKLQRRPAWQRRLVWCLILVVAALAGGYGALTLVGVPGWLPAEVSALLDRLPLVDG